MTKDIFTLGGLSAFAPAGVGAKAEKLKPQPDGMDDLYLRWTNKTLDENMGASANLPQLCADSESRLTQAGIDDG